MKYSRPLFGVIYPALTLIVGMIALANVESAAGAGEFAGIAVFIMLLMALPLTLLLNCFILAKTGTNVAHYKRGMILPCLFFIFTIVYQTGLWDKLT